ncbi:hypothetical protein PSTT_10408 [Puccinia striiformis]|uniref:Protein-S-isoprenylcysteine O-methyltransferase n=1 Tax=Puccinia striiformis TaxID=27350 RepID=A0A2S4V4N8_9BASI|nr:hypothetical protein PSTT_10408 [Puccinia striiformis]
MKCLVLVTHFDIFCIQLSIALFLFPLHRLNHLRQLTNTHPWIARSIGITSPASTLSTSFFSHPLAATMAKDFQAFRAHPPLWEDGHQTDERPNEKESTDSEPPRQHDISWPLTSFANTIQNVCCISFLFGFFLCLNLAFIFLSNQSHQWTRLNIYFIQLTAFHLLEFLTTAIFNPSRVTVDSFLLNNGSSYWFAQILSVLEYVIREKYFGGTILVTIDSSIVRVLGLVISLGGQIIRSLAMITAANSFNHRVSTHSKKQDDHTLVTNGIYQFSRHPSYFGFFWWSIGIQLFLANPFSLAIFSFVLWSFFNSRIQNEELHLVKFFGKAYITYRSTIPTRIPFIK